MSNTYNIPVWEKYTLSIEEAAAYFRIGDHKLRNIISENTIFHNIIHDDMGHLLLLYKHDIRP